MTPEDQRQLGQLIEAVSGMKSDRAEFRADFEKAIGGLAADVRQLSQTVTSTAANVASLVSLDLGSKIMVAEGEITELKLRLRGYEALTARLGVLEDDSRFYKGIVGTGAGIVWRLGALITSSGLLATIVAKWWH